MLNYYNFSQYLSSTVMNEVSLIYKQLLLESPEACDDFRHNREEMPFLGNVIVSGYLESQRMFVTIQLKDIKSGFLYHRNEIFLIFM